MMNTDLKLKFLQYLNQKKQSSGFTIIELLVVIFIIGVGIAIFFPSFLLPSCACNKGKQSEPRTYVGTINKGQQAYYTEKSKFSQSVADLGVGIRTASINYNYHTKLINQGTNSVAVGYSTTTTAGAALKNYVGYVSLITNKDNSKELTSVAILCEQKKAGDPASFNIEWKVGIEPPKCNQSQVPVGGT